MAINSSVSKYGETFRGLAGLVLQRHSDDAVLHLATPSAFSIDTGAEEEPINAMNPLGQGITIGSIQRAIKPTLSVTYGVHQPEIYEFILGRKFDQIVKTETFIRQYTVRASLVEEPAAIGTLGAGFPADITSCYASAKGDFSSSMQLTRVPWASTPGPNEFAQGPDMAIKWGTNLMNQTITLTVNDGPQSNVLALSEESSGFLKMKALLVTNTDEGVIVNADSVVTQVAGRSIDPMSTDISLSFFMHGLPGRCDPGFDMRWTGKKIAC